MEQQSKPPAPGERDVPSSVVSPPTPTAPDAASLSDPHDPRPAPDPSAAISNGDAASLSSSLKPPGLFPAATSVTDAPPFWTSRTRQNRSVSTISYHSIQSQRPPPISLEDRSDEHNVLAQGCWASSVTIDEYVTVAGQTGVGAYIVWHCTVRTLKGGDLALRKRYSEFDRLRTNLVRAFPHAEAMIPELPRKSLVSRFRPKFLELRRQGLTHFLNCIVLNPEFAASPMLKEFIFS